MRIVLFYSETESFNFFSDVLAEEFQKRGHETFILDLLNPPSDQPHSYVQFSKFASSRVDAAVCFDGLGIRDDILIEIWDAYRTAVIDILLDPPLRFHSTLEKHPRNYHLFCCDLNHVEYVRKYFGHSVPHVDFMPHVGVMPEKDVPVIPYAEKKYDILFPGAYCQPESMLAQIEELFGKDTLLHYFYLSMFNCLVENTSLTVEQAALRAVRQMNFNANTEDLKRMLSCAVPVDWAIRMYQRGRVVSVLADAGFELYLLGSGWKNHSSVSRPNVHRSDDCIPYADTLPYIADARINLNVLPWFKAGTHDRIFNALLRHSLPLTDPSRWITENFTDGEDIALYDLEHLELLPGIADRLLQDTDRAESVIQKGYEKTIRNLTWSDCTDWILDTVRRML